MYNKNEKKVLNYQISRICCYYLKQLIVGCGYLILLFLRIGRNNNDFIKSTH